MKKIVLIFSIILGVMISTIDNVQAQQINISINIGSQPSWGPTGYDYVDYYYLPDINVYYMVNSRLYVYYDRGRWISARYLPQRYRHYDLYGMYKVVFAGPHRNPWVNNHRHYREYSRYKNYRGQHVIRDSRDRRYRESRNNNILWYQDARPNNSNTRPSNSSARPSNRVDRNNDRSSSRSSSSSRSTSSSRSNNTKTVNYNTSSGKSSDKSSVRSSNRNSSSNRDKNNSSSRSSSSRSNNNSSSRSR